MARLNARWYNFVERGQAWWHFWQDSSTTAAPAATGSGAGTVGLASSAVGAKGATSSQSGAAGIAALDAAKKAAASSAVGAVGTGGSEAGADGVAFGAVGRSGLTSSAVGIRHATVSASTGASGISGASLAAKAATAASVSRLGEAGAAVGGNIIVAFGSGSGSLGDSASASGQAGAAQVIEQPSGGSGLYIRAKALISKILQKPARHTALGRHIGGALGATGSASGLAEVTVLHRSLNFAPAATGSASGSSASILGSSRGEAFIRIVTPAPLPEPISPQPTRAAPPVPPPPLPAQLSRPPALTLVGSGKGAHSILGAARGEAVPVPPQETEEEVMFIIDLLLAA